MSHIFLAYDPYDEPFAEQVANLLVSAHFNVVRYPKAEWDSQRDESIANCKAFLLILSENGLSSSDITYQWAFAIGRNRPIVPILRETVAIHPRLAEFEALDFKEKIDIDSLIQKLEQLVDVYATSPLTKTRPFQSGKSRDGKTAFQLVAQLIDKNATQRRSAIEELGRRREHNATSQLLRLLEDVDPSVRVAAAHALGRLHEPKAAEKLAKLLIQDSSARVRAAAAEALWGLNDATTAEPLRIALSDQSPDVRKIAAYALGSLKDIPALDKLIACLNDKDVLVRVAAVTALGYLGEISTILPLSERLEKDTSIVVRAAAAHALGNIGSSTAIPMLEKALEDEHHVASAAEQALSRLKANWDVSKEPA